MAEKVVWVSKRCRLVLDEEVEEQVEKMKIVSRIERFCL